MYLYHTYKRIYILYYFNRLYFSYLHAFVTYYRLIFDKMTYFGLVGLFYQRKWERKGGNLRDREEGDKEDVG